MRKNQLRCCVCGGDVERRAIAGDLRLVVSFRNGTHTEQAGRVCQACVTRLGQVSPAVLAGALRTAIPAGHADA